MAVKPESVCVLEKGKLIDVQEGFVDTFNWLVSFCSNIDGEKGEVTGDDGDDDDDGKFVAVVDKEVSDFPVIRIEGKMAKSGGGKEYVAGDDTNIVFTPETDDDGNETGTVKVDVYYK